MYAFVSGTLEDAGPPVVVDVGGVGYELAVPESHRLALPPRGQAVRLYTHLHVREDELSLFGFPTLAEREIFRALLSVSGVGPKVALAILGTGDRDGILLGLARGDHQPLTRVKGVGKKTAERLVLELQERAAAWAPSGRTRAAAAGEAAADELDADEREAALALVAMGLSPDRARDAVLRVPEAERSGRDVTALIRLALRRAEL